MLVLSNSFSLNMLSDDYLGEIYIDPQTPQGAAIYLAMEKGHITNVIGHADTDAIVRQLLQAACPSFVPPLVIPPAERKTIALKKGDRILVAQYRGARLGEGTRVLPDGAHISFSLVSIYGEDE